MRILDLGAHDGFISAFVADHLDVPAGDTLRVDGIELNEHAVEVFARRMRERNIAGTCFVGAAEDAPQLFEPGHHDAVVAYELIEHVPDVDAFLDACEQMCAPNGRVYLSTPNGTFGEGRNPHHLRVYRAVDMAELLRRRGNLHEVGVGPDGLTLASYTPWSAYSQHVAHGQGEVAIYCGPGWQTWGPPMIELPGGLGGSETAAIRLADALTNKGYTVTVYGEVEPGCYGQVVYRHHSTFDPLTRRDAVILSRTPWIADRPILADRVLLWMHDTDYGPGFTESMAARIDQVMVLSDWHRGHVQTTYPFLDNIAVTANAIQPDYFTPGELPPRDPYKVIYSSSPDRGLDLLLEWWPKVVEQVPEAQLVFCYADVYAAVAGQRPEVAEHHQLIGRLAEQPNVHNLGALSQPDLASAMLQSGVWVAPSWNSPSGRPFMETYCIGAVEAAAAGCALVASHWGALPERLLSVGKDVMLLDADGKPDPDRWVPAIVRAMKVAAAGDVGQSDAALQTTWDLVADDFIEQMVGVTA